MMKKDLLKRDMFLLISSTPYERLLTISFAEMILRPVEIINLSSNTTESDLKQRKEIKLV